MNPITTCREADIDQPFHSLSRFLGTVLTSDEWSGERGALVGRTNLHFAIAVRHVEATNDSVLFRIIADSPDLRHPFVGRIEALPRSSTGSRLRVEFSANLDEEPDDRHAGVREALASLADVLARTVVTAADGHDAHPVP